MIGIDIVDIEKFNNKENIIRIFTQSEIAYAKSKANPSVTLAGIYAAKEAAIKAHNLNLAYILRKKIEIRHTDNKPILYLEGNKSHSSISISHDGNYTVGICYVNDSGYAKEIDIDIAQLLPKRESNSHKGDYGRIAILGGSAGMAGSVFMASLASMRAGAGLTYILAPKSISNILEIKSNEVIIQEISCNNYYYNEQILGEILDKLEDKDILAIGPGMGKAKELEKLIARIISDTNLDMVIDADGLNAVSNDPSILKSDKNIILTPHLKEFSRLTGLSIEQNNQNQEEIAKKFAQEYKVILVLKSHKTLVTDGDRIYRNKIGNPGMATAGSGDVLTGVIASLLHILDPFDAARLGVYIHSLAGDVASLKFGEDSIVATDIIDNIPEAIKQIRESNANLRRS